jgi:hypothetical protein
MKKMLLLCGALLAISAAAASAQISTPGLNLGWGNCIGDNGTALKTFACTSTTGSQSIVASYVSSVEVPTYAASELFINFAVTGGSTPAWWGTACAGRTAPFAVNFTISGTAVNCVDIWNAAGVGGIAAYNQNWNGAGTTQLDIAAAVPTGSEVDVLPGQEMFLANILLSNSKSTVASGCVGCLQAACINFKELRVDEPGKPEVKVTQGGVQPFIYWQAASASCVAATPTHNTTWGSVKALYR